MFCLSILSALAVIVGEINFIIITDSEGQIAMLTLSLSLSLSLSLCVCVYACVDDFESISASTRYGTRTK